jgi:putative PIN family toxin of toxin-antitoxin system
VKVVFDTNVLVSALVFPGGRGEEALSRIIAERDELILSKPILDELLAVLARKFSRDTEELARVALFLADIGSMVKPRRRVAVLKDAADNRILECALAGRAQAVVTGDKALLALEEYQGVRILSLASFLEER